MALLKSLTLLWSFTVLIGGSLSLFSMVSAMSIPMSTTIGISGVIIAMWLWWQLVKKLFSVKSMTSFLDRLLERV